MRRQWGHAVGRGEGMMAKEKRHKEELTHEPEQRTPKATLELGPQKNRYLSVLINS